MRNQQQSTSDVVVKNVFDVLLLLQPASSFKLNGCKMSRKLFDLGARDTKKSCAEARFP